MGKLSSGVSRVAKYQVTFHPGVNSQLESHAEFIARVSLPAAYRMKEEFDVILGRLAENPFQFPPMQNPNLPADTYRGASFAKWYQIVFSVESYMVYVDAVVDMRSDYTI